MLERFDPRRVRAEAVLNLDILSVRFVLFLQGSAQCCHQAAEGSMFRCKQTVSSGFSLRLQI